MNSQKDKDIDNDQDINNEKFFPVANISRIMKNCLPDDQNVKISKDSKNLIQQSVSDFVTFVTSEGNLLKIASEKCLKEKRKTINGEDILHSLHILGFGKYNDNLKMFLNKYRESQTNQVVQQKQLVKNQFDDQENDYQQNESDSN